MVILDSPVQFDIFIKFGPPDDVTMIQRASLGTNAFHRKRVVYNHVTCFLCVFDTDVSLIGS